MKVPFKNIAKRLRGFSSPLFGVSWEPPTSDQEIVRKLILYLEDRRVLFYHLETRWDGGSKRPYVVVSILEIRKHLNKEIQNLNKNSELIPHFRAMRAACRKFLDSGMRKFGGRFLTQDFRMALGELRGVFGIHIAQLCVKYGIDVNQELASILPVEDKGK